MSKYLVTDHVRDIAPTTSVPKHQSAVHSCDTMLALLRREDLKAQATTPLSVCETTSATYSGDKSTLKPPMCQYSAPAPPMQRVGQSEAYATLETCMIDKVLPRFRHMLMPNQEQPIQPLPGRNHDILLTVNTLLRHSWKVYYHLTSDHRHDHADIARAEHEAQATWDTRNASHSHSSFQHQKNINPSKQPHLCCDFSPKGRQNYTDEESVPTDDSPSRSSGIFKDAAYSLSQPPLLWHHMLWKFRLKY